MERDKILHFIASALTFFVIFAVLWFFRVNYRGFIASLGSILLWIIKDEVIDRLRKKYDPFDLKADFCGVWVASMIYLVSFLFL